MHTYIHIFIYIYYIIYDGLTESLGVLADATENRERSVRVVNFILSLSSV